VIDTRPVELSDLRRRVRQFVASVGCVDGLGQDLELVVSELATNVIRHTGAPSMKVHVDVATTGGHQQWTVRVENQVVPIRLDGSGPVGVPSGGRGLRIVAAIMDDINVSESEGRMTIRATRAVPV
jgi:anti-sigma regulatory factor (Ser/Thr protein kinase)